VAALPIALERQCLGGFRVRKSSLAASRAMSHYSIDFAHQLDILIKIKFSALILPSQK
jgi:hypothetical protein